MWTDIVMGSLMLLSMAFFGWLTSQAPPGLGQLLVPALAIIAIAAMYAFLTQRRYR